MKSYLLPVFAAAICLNACSTVADLPVAKEILKPRVQTELGDLKDGTFKLEPTHAFLHFSMRHMGLSDLTGRFDRFDMNVSLDKDVPENSSVTANIDVSSLYLATPDFSQTIQGKDWLNASTHPKAVFRSTNITVTGPKEADVTGTLELNGHTGPASLHVIFNGGADVAITGKYMVGFNATGSFNRSDFGIGQYTAFVSDAVTLTFSGEFERVE